MPHIFVSSDQKPLISVKRPNHLVGGVTLDFRVLTASITEKNGFDTATKLGTTNTFLLLPPKISLQQLNVLLIELNILLL